MSLETCALSELPDVIAPDSSEVRILATTQRGSMAQFTLPPGAVSKAVSHRTVEELWFVIHGVGLMWRKLGGEEVTVALRAGISISIPVGSHFQFRNDSLEPLHCIGVTMPPWPSMDEAYEVDGPWQANSVATP